MMSPLLNRERRRRDGSMEKYQVPLYEEFALQMRKLDEPDYKEEDSERKTREEKRKDLLGPELNLSSPDLYQEIGMLKELNLLQHWDQFDITRKAEIIAYYRLSRMEEFLIRWKDTEMKKKT